MAVSVPGPPQLDFLPLNGLLGLRTIHSRPPSPVTVDRFAADGLIEPADVDFIYHDVFRKLALITLGSGVTASAGWATYLLLGGMQGVWTRKRNVGIVLVGASTAFFTACAAGYIGGQLWVAEGLFKRMPQTAERNLLTYRYAHAADPATLPSPSAGPLFDSDGQARFSFAGGARPVVRPTRAPGGAADDSLAIVRILKAGWGATAEARQKLSPSFDGAPDGRPPGGAVESVDTPGVDALSTPPTTETPALPPPAAASWSAPLEAVASKSWAWLRGRPEEAPTKALEQPPAGVQGAWAQVDDNRRPPR